MKSILFSILCLTLISAYSQTTFESEADVLQYLTTKGQFTNRGTNITLTFSDMGSSLSSGRSSYFNPQVTLVSSTRAVVEYQSLNNPDVTVQFIVDSRENVIMDKRDRSIYKAYSYEEKEPIRKNERIPITSTKKVNYLIIKGETKIPNSFVGKFIQGNNYVIITKTSDRKGSMSVSFNGKKYTAPFNPNNYMDANNIMFFNSVVTFKVFGIDNNSNIIKEIDLRINYSGDNWNTDSDEDAKKIRFRRQ